jgi:hypothetical protein
MRRKEVALQDTTHSSHWSSSVPERPHPAKYSNAILEQMRPYLHGRVLDPFAGTGKLRDIYPEAYLNELEPEWAVQGPASTIGDALHLPYAKHSFDTIATSPCYGNRMADHHNAADASKRITYRHTLGRPLHTNSAGSLQWGEKYRNFHVEAWYECHRVLKPGGLFLLNVSDHIRNGMIVNVSAWHNDVLAQMGFMPINSHLIRTPRMRRGANYDLRVEHEFLFVVKKT